MQSVLIATQVIFSVLLSLAVLLQHRSVGLSATFGGSGGFYTSKRGAEKILYNSTIILAILFVVNSVAFIFV